MKGKQLDDTADHASKASLELERRNNGGKNTVARSGTSESKAGGAPDRVSGSAVGLDLGQEIVFRAWDGARDRRHLDRICHLGV
jgi:hypothetical protein